MAEELSSAHFVSLFRAVAPYVNLFRGKTFVIAFGGRAISGPFARSLAYDANLLAAGFSLFNAGLRPAVLPQLCFGNDWYMHTVTTGVWEREIGKVYQSAAELQFGSL